MDYGGTGTPGTKRIFTWGFSGPARSLAQIAGVSVKLGIVIKKYRLMMELDLRTLSKEIGIGAATLLRIERGYGVDYATFKKILDWLSK